MNSKISKGKITLAMLGLVVVAGVGLSLLQSDLWKRERGLERDVWRRVQRELVRHQAEQIQRLYLRTQVALRLLEQELVEQGLLHLQAGRREHTKNVRFGPKHQAIGPKHQSKARRQEVARQVPPKKELGALTSSRPSSHDASGLQRRTKKAHRSFPNSRPTAFMQGNGQKVEPGHRVLHHVVRKGSPQAILHTLQRMRRRTGAVGLVLYGTETFRALTKESVWLSGGAGKSLKRAKASGFQGFQGPRFEANRMQFHGLWWLRLSQGSGFQTLVQEFDLRDWAGLNRPLSPGFTQGMGICDKGSLFLLTSKENAPQRYAPTHPFAKEVCSSLLRKRSSARGEWKHFAWHGIPAMGLAWFVRRELTEKAASPPWIRQSTLFQLAFWGGLWIGLVGLFLRFGVAFFRPVVQAQVASEAPVLLGESLLLEGSDAFAKERRLFLRELEQSELKFRTLFDNASDAILLVDVDQKIRLFNHQAESLFGYQAEEILGQPLAMLLPEEVRQRHKQHMEHFRQGTVTRLQMDARSELAGHHKDGSLFAVEISIAKMHIGDELLFAAIVRDISEKKVAQAALQRAYQELEERVEIRTRELREANEELKTFAYTVSHDLRAPLVNMKGFCGELRLSLDELSEALGTLLDEQGQKEVAFLLKTDLPESLEFIEAATSRMERLTGAVLKLARIGHQRFVWEPLRLNLVVNDILASMGHQIVERDVQIEVGELGEIVGDRTSIEQILANVLHNAITYLQPDRAGYVTVSLEKKKSSIVLHIKDNGRGIAEEDFPKVFQIFRRAGDQEHPGEGMGLSYVQALIRRYGGEIRFSSEVGVGTTFSLSFPNEPRRA